MTSRGARWTVVVVASFALIGTLASARAEPAPQSAVAPAQLEHAVPLGLTPGETISIRGEMRTSFDGVTYDGAARYDENEVRLGGLFAIEDTGLRLSKRERGRVHLEATGAHAPICAALHIASPCLVPRTSVLAHERLLTEAQFFETLKGNVSFELPPPPARPAIAWKWLLAPLAIGGVLLLTAGGIVSWIRHRERTLTRIRRAAKEARGIAQDQPGADVLLRQIDALVEHATKLARAEATSVAQIRRRAKERVGVRASTELERLRKELERARSGQGDILEALHVLALRGIDESGPLAEAERALARLDEELALRRDAESEASAALHEVH